MSSYKPKKKIELSFEDDTVQVQFKLLTRGQFAKMLPFFSKVQGEAPEPEALLSMLDAANEFIDDVVIKFNGLFDEEGNELEFKVVKEDQFFINLYVEMLGKIIEESSVKEKKPSTLKPVSDSTSQGSA